MKMFIIVPVLFIMLACNQADDQYEGPVVNAKCALDVFPPDIALLYDSIKAESARRDTADPLVRENGVMVCRSF